MKSVGLLGGSFDPPHKGHLYISLEAKKILQLDEVWWLVTPQNPLKISKPATYNERLKNCYNLIKTHPIILKQIEKKINSQYSYYTIKYLCNHYPNIKFYWLMGADNLISFHKWQKWNEFFNKISIVVFKRHGYNNIALNSKTKKKFNSFLIDPNQLDQIQFSSLPSWTILHNKEIRISSTEIRNQRKLLRG